ncbi:MAG TPA: tetratricopeptide repeat protein [Xanthomonadaceae bacterium]|nr:tetratricopeptide repeat protein [Xanthomonadaceae bacterium]
MLQDVIDALRRKDPEALALARAEAAAAPGSAHTQYLCGIAQREAGDAVGARASFDRAIELAPDESVYHFSRASLAYAEDDFVAANRSSAHAIALDPNLFDAYLLRIQLAVANGDHAEAERQLNLAERVDPEHPQLLFVAGQIALVKGDGERAVKLLSKAAAERPNDVQILATLGMAYLRQGYPAFAEQAARKGMSIDPGATDLRRLLIEALINQDRNGDAEAELAVYRQQRPQDPFGAVIHGEMQVRAGNPTGALANYRAALKQAPRNLRALMGMQNMLEALADRALARSIWEEVLQWDSGFDPIWVSRLTVTDDGNDYGDVLRRWREALPGSTVAVLNQARHDDINGRNVEAEAGYDAVLARTPHQLDALLAKAVFVLHRDPAAGTERLNVLIEHASSPQAKAALALRGHAHDRLQQTQKAMPDWQQAHAGYGSLPPMQPLPPETSNALVANVPAASGNVSVVMLWGPPGSGSERLAAALRLNPGRPLLEAMRNLQPRMPQFPDAFIARALNAEELPDVIREVAAVYASIVEPYLRQGNQGVFDWLAQWDARVVPLLRHALPGTRLIAMLRDPRDLLLNWLAFGAPAGPAFADPVVSAAWLANQLEHLLFSRDALQLPVLIVDMDRFDADPVTTMQEIASFADLPTAPDPQPALNGRSGPGRLSTLLPTGRWRAYRNELDVAFEVLTPLAERLGYPRE